MIWSNRLLRTIDLTQKSGASNVLKLAVSYGSGAGCLYDSILVDWTSASSTTDEWLIAITVNGRDEVAIRPMFDQYRRPSAIRNVTRIECLVNEEHCIPTVGNVIAMTKGDPSITVEFNEETSTPDLSTYVLLSAALIMNPPLIGGAVGIWKDEKTLSIAVDRVYLDDMVGAHTRGETVGVSLRFYAADDGSDSDSDSDSDNNHDITGLTRTEDGSTYQTADYTDNDNSSSNSNGNGTAGLGDLLENKRQKGQTGRKVQSGQIRLRPTEHGSTRIFVINAATLSLISNIIEFDVKICDEQLVPPLTLRKQYESDSSSGGDNDSDSDSNSNSHTDNPPVAVIRIKGVLSMTGKDPIIIPNNAVPEMVIQLFLIIYFNLSLFISA